MIFEVVNGPVSARRIKLAVVSLMLFGSVGGCGAQGSGSFTQLIPVKGKVTLKGQSVTIGTIRFEPDDYGRPASGKLQSDGTFVLTTLKEGDGVVAGHHRVSITNFDIKSKEGALLRKSLNASKSRLEADVSPEKTEFTFDIQ
jgi:hypothetical protein